MTLDTLEICFQANMTGITAQLNSLVSQLSAFSSHASSAGYRMAQSLAQGLTSGMPLTVSARDALLNAASFSGTNAVSEAFSAGAALSQGLANGILSKKSAVISASRSVSNAAANAMRSTLNIHSPSKVSRALGADFSQGFSLGIGNAMEDVRKRASGLASAAAAGLSAAAVTLPEISSSDGIGSLHPTAQDVHLTIHINVDGMRLGEASIRGINAVTRATGKLLLNI